MAKQDGVTEWLQKIKSKIIKISIIWSWLPTSLWVSNSKVTNKPRTLNLLHRYIKLVAWTGSAEVQKIVRKHFEKDLNKFILY